MTTVQGAAVDDEVEITHVVRGRVVYIGDRHVRLYLDKVDSIGRAYADFPVDSITVKVLPPPVKVGDVITTVEGLKALPVGTVGRTGSGMVAEKGAPGLWYLVGISAPIRRERLNVPFTVIDLPKEDEND
jgi:hypothetical protein